MPRTRLAGLGLAAALVLAAVLSAEPAQPAKGTRYAFLVACSRYQFGLPELSFTGREARDFRDVLVQTGFDRANVVLLADGEDGRYLPEHAKILRELDLLLAAVGPDDTVVVVLDGHGVQFRDERVGYFCPADARVGDRKTLVPLEGQDGLLERLKACKARQKLLLVSACRNDPELDRVMAPDKVDLDKETATEVPEGVAALFSCRPREKSRYYDPKSKETPGLERSLFFHHLIETWKGSYATGDAKAVTLEDIFREVRTRTAADARRLFGELQVPDPRREYRGEWVVKDLPRDRDVGRTTGPREGLLGMKFVRLPKGTFYMGGGGGKAGTKTEIKEDFWIAAHTVTQGQWQDVMGDNPSWFSRKGGGADKLRDISDADLRQFPVEQVSWEDAQRFIAKLNERERGRGWLYRLPSEAEWEYACRGGATSEEECSYDFYLSRPTNDLSSDQANFYGNSPAGKAPKGPYLERPTKVGSYPANKLGLYDMHGNVWQWCADLYESGGSDRVIRGGGWSSDASLCRASVRGGGAPSDRYFCLGFRLAAVPVR